MLWFNHSFWYTPLVDHFYLQKLINLFWQKYIRQFLNGPNVTCPVCKTLTQTVTALLKRYGLLSESSLARKKCRDLTTVFDTHLIFSWKNCILWSIEKDKSPSLPSADFLPSQISSRKTHHSSHHWRPQARKRFYTLYGHQKGTIVGPEMNFKCPSSQRKKQNAADTFQSTWGRGSDQTLIAKLSPSSSFSGRLS